MKIEKAINTEAEALTELTIRSKAYWGYSPEQMEKWRTALTLTVDYFEQTEVYKLTQENQLLGYYSYLALTNQKVKLDNIFIEPSQIGKGYGKILMDHFLDLVKQNGFEIVTLDSEPKAEKFYQKLGFTVVGQLETSIKNRFLPTMELVIKQH